MVMADSTDSLAWDVLSVLTGFRLRSRYLGEFRDGPTYEITDARADDRKVLFASPSHAQARAWQINRQVEEIVALVERRGAAEGQARPGARSDGGEAAVSEDIAAAEAAAENPK